MEMGLKLRSYFMLLSKKYKIIFHEVIDSMDNEYVQNGS